MATYDSPVRMTYSALAAAVDTAGTVLIMSGPKGMKGRVESITFVATVATTVAATILSVGSISDTDKYATNTVPVSAIGAVSNTTTILHTDTNLIPENEAVALASDGGATAGDGNISVVIAWF